VGIEVRTAGDVQAPYPDAPPVAPHPGHGTICKKSVQHQYLLANGTHRQTGLREYLLKMTDYLLAYFKAIFDDRVNCNSAYTELIPAARLSYIQSSVNVLILFG
jgi:hypothetical protein